MSCLINSGIARTCEFTTGGINRLYVANYDEVESFSASTMSGVIDTIVMTSGATFHEIVNLKDTASFTQELVVSEGQKFYTQNLVFNVSSNSEIKDGTEDGVQSVEEAQELQDLIDKLNLGKYIFIAQSRSGKFYILGKLNGLETSASTFGTGAAGGDFAGYVMTFDGQETKGAPLFDGTIPLA